jgi:hypothetical protein
LAKPNNGHNAERITMSFIFSPPPAFSVSIAYLISIKQNAADDDDLVVATCSHG